MAKDNKPPSGQQDPQNETPSSGAPRTGELPESGQPPAEATEKVVDILIVKPGMSLTSLRGVIDGGSEVAESDWSPKETLGDLIARGHVIKSTKTVKV